MTPRPILASALAAAALALLAAPAAAQQGRAGVAASPRVLARYDFAAPKGGIPFPSTITVADSAGQLVASARVAGSLAPVPMVVHVIESDLVLEAATSDGILTVVLDKQAEGGAIRVSSGRWVLGKTEGRLRARA